MWLLYYYLKMRFACMRRHKPFHVTCYYKGWKMYNAYCGTDKKSRFRVICELDRLSKYWRGFPDAYFIFSMFKKGFGDFDKMTSFIPQCAYGRYARNHEPAYQILINDKILFHDMMRVYGIPTTERYFTYSNHRFKRNGKVIDDAEVNRILSSITDEHIFVKLNKCGSGSGVILIERKEDGYYTPDGVCLSAETIRQRHYNHELLFEKQIVQSELTARFNPDSVNTCRVLTYKNKVVAGSLRMGRKGCYVDNAAKGGLVVSIEMETGRLSDYGLRAYDATKYYEHPDTHEVFKGTVISDWHKVKELVEKASELMPYYNSVGFDIVCTPTGPIIIEINTGADAFVSQMGREFGIAAAFLKN